MVGMVALLSVSTEALLAVGCAVAVVVMVVVTVLPGQMGLLPQKNKTTCFLIDFVTRLSHDIQLPVPNHT